MLRPADGSLVFGSIVSFGRFQEFIYGHHIGGGVCRHSLGLIGGWGWPLFFGVALKSFYLCFEFGGV